MSKFCKVVSVERHVNLTGKLMYRYLLGCGKTVMQRAPKTGPAKSKFSCNCKKD